jgi:AcrR family transcriptional regulator
VNAILQACARLLAEEGYAKLTTNGIARRAGVGIGSLYEFFPNREAILLALAQQRLARLERAVREGLERALAREGGSAVEPLIRCIVDAVSDDRELHRVLLREASFLRDSPEIQRAISALFELARMGAERARSRVALPNPRRTSWLIGHMLANVVLEIAFLDAAARRREELIRELVRLTTRMLRPSTPV